MVRDHWFRGPIKFRGLILALFCFSCFLSLTSIFSSSFSQETLVSNPSLSVDEAYRAIPHRQTLFDPKQARMTEKTKAFFEDLFHLTDQAMTHRVEALLWVQTQGQRGISYKTYEAKITPILQEIQALKPPGRLVRLKKLIAEAIQEQKEYFNSWNAGEYQGKKRRFNPRHARVKSSHQKFTKAYQLLMQVYPSAGAYNRQAFFDHLSALDFL